MSRRISIGQFLKEGLLKDRGQTQLKLLPPDWPGKLFALHFLWVDIHWIVPPAVQFRFPCRLRAGSLTSLVNYQEMTRSPVLTIS